MRWSLNHARMTRCFTDSWRSIHGCELVLWANELTPRGHLRPLGGRENPRRARPESRSPRRCANAWRRCLLFAGRPEGTDQGTHDRHARASPLPQLRVRKGVNRNPSRRPGLAVSDSNLHAVKTGHSELAAFPGCSPSRCPRSAPAGLSRCSPLRTAPRLPSFPSTL